MIYHGIHAVTQVEKVEGIKLSYEERRIIMVEGYATTVYFDTKGIRTKGGGQTGKWIDKSFRESCNYHKDRARKRCPFYDTYPEYLRAEILQAEYRGDLGMSPKTVQLINDGRYVAAAEEFLDHREYKDPSTSSGIKKRLEAVHHALQLYSKQL